MNIFQTIGLGVCLAAVIAAGAYTKGRSDGRIAQMQDTVVAYQKRGSIDHAVGQLDGVSMCLELGGLRDDCQQLRGLDGSAKDK